MEDVCGALRSRGLPTEGDPAGRSRVRPVLGAGPLIPPYPPAAPKIRPRYGRIGKMSGPRSNSAGAGADDLALAAADESYEAERILGSEGVAERVVPILQKWLDPHCRRYAGSESGSVTDALAAASFLDYSQIRELAPSLMFWSYAIRHRGRVLELLGHLGHSDLRRVVVAYVRDMVTTSADLEWMDYWDSAHMLHYFGFYDEARWVVDQARAQGDPEIRDEMREIEEFVFGAPEGGGE